MIESTEKHTAAECNRCGWGGCTCNTTRDALKARAHAHIEATGHTIRWADGATLGVTDAPDVTGDQGLWPGKASR